MLLDSLYTKWFKLHFFVAIPAGYPWVYPYPRYTPTRYRGMGDLRVRVRVKLKYPGVYLCSSLLFSGPLVSPGPPLGTECHCPLAICAGGVEYSPRSAPTSWLWDYTNVVRLSMSKPRSVLGLIVQSTTTEANKNNKGETQVCTLE